jgi:3-deoxy-manno-octulosonate cytidylyltransferase (CMP-KDO synthetase)
VTAAVAIPARLRSSRLPRKVLADIAGSSMLRRTYEVAVDAGCGPVIVLTDAEEVAVEARSFGATVLMTAPEVESGTARIASVLDRIDADIVVNLQGDAPLTDPDVLTRSVQEAERSGALVTMPVHRIDSTRDVFDPNVVKVIRGRDGRALYCSRTAVPYVRDADAGQWLHAARFWAHMGLYAYRRDFLAAFDAFPPSPLEDAERLEQLRWLEAGVRVHTFEVAPQGPSVDTPGDLERVRAAFLAGAAR